MNLTTAAIMTAWWLFAAAKVALLIELHANRRLKTSCYGEPSIIELALVNAVVLPFTLLIWHATNHSKTLQLRVYALGMMLLLSLISGFNSLRIYIVSSCRHYYWLDYSFLDAIPAFVLVFALLNVLAFGIYVRVMMATQQQKPYVFWLWGRWVVAIGHHGEAVARAASHEDVHRGLTNEPYLPWYVEAYFRTRYEVNGALGFQFLDETTSQERAARRELTEGQLRSAPTIPDMIDPLAAFLRDQVSEAETLLWCRRMVLTAFRTGVSVDAMKIANHDQVMEQAREDADTLHHVIVGGERLFNMLLAIKQYTEFLSSQGLQKQIEPRAYVEQAIMSHGQLDVFHYRVLRVASSLDDILPQRFPAGTVILLMVRAAASNVQELFLTCCGREWALSMLEAAVIRFRDAGANLPDRGIPKKKKKSKVVQPVRRAGSVAAIPQLSLGGSTAGLGTSASSSLLVPAQQPPNSARRSESRSPRL